MPAAITIVLRRNRRGEYRIYGLVDKKLYLIDEVPYDVRPKDIEKEYGAQFMKSDQGWYYFDVRHNS